MSPHEPRLQAGINRWCLIAASGATATMPAAAASMWTSDESGISGTCPWHPQCLTNGVELFSESFLAPLEDRTGGRRCDYFAHPTKGEVSPRCLETCALLHAALDPEWFQVPNSEGLPTGRRSVGHGRWAAEQLVA